MIIDLECLMNGASDVLELDTALDFSEETLNASAFAFDSPVAVRGKITNQAGIVTLDAAATFTFSFDCDRCAAPTTKEVTVPMHHTLLRELSNDRDWEDYIVCPDLQLDLSQLTKEDVFLFFPGKLLCRPDCKGLCAQCGANLNDGPCGCKKEIDPRLEGLLSLLDE